MFSQGPLPHRRAGLQLVPWGTEGGGVVKNPETQEYFQLGSQEFFLLSRLEGTTSREALGEEYAARFARPLADEYLAKYIEFASTQGWLETSPPPSPCPAVAPGIENPVPSSGPTALTRDHAVAAGMETSPTPATACGPATAAPQGTAASAPPARPAPPRNVLYFRFKLFDPDRVLTAMAPRLWFLWTWPFALASLAGMLSAAFLLWTNRGEFGSAIVDSPGWHSLVAVYATIVLVTIVHEFAHGLTCKHYGGKVQEMGFLVMMLMPCLYCNVSDAWMIPDKRKRMLITLAGAWSDLTVWAVGVHLWRLTMPDTLPHHIAALAVSVTGFRTFINLLPLLKLDGYYLLSDWLDAPNLKQRGTEAFQRGVRHAVWGEQPATPAPAGHRGFALYGMLSWIAMVVMIAGLGLAIYHFLGSRWGALGIAGAVMLGLAARQIVAGLGPSQTAVGIVSRERGLRFGFWLAVVAGVLCIPVPDLIHGAFELRPKVRMQIRAPVAGFVRSLQFEEGARLSAGTVVGTLEVPDLDSRLGQKRAELQEAHARLALLKAGPREEDLEWQRRKVQTSKTRVATAEQRLERTRLEAQEESARLEQKVSQHLAESQAAKDAHRRASALFRSGIVTGESVTELQKREQAMDARLGQVKAEQRGHAVIAARDAEEELALRREELREAEAELELVEAGSRPEEIDAEQARIARLNEELAYLETLQSRQKITSPVSGVVTSRHLKEKVGEYLKEGDLICEVEDTSEFDAEVMVLEDELARLREEQPLRLKVRAMPFDAFDARIERIAPRASKQTAHSEAIVICRVKDPQQRLRPGMTGSACIDAGDKMLGRLLLDRSLRFVRTEFWWW